VPTISGMQAMFQYDRNPLAKKIASGGTNRLRTQQA
jgi:hypothetical protein